MQAGSRWDTQCGWLAGSVSGDGFSNWLSHIVPLVEWVSVVSNSVCTVTVTVTFTFTSFTSSCFFNTPQ